MEQKKWKNYGAAWDKDGDWGPSISVCLDVETFQEFVNTAKDGKFWLTLKPNTKKEKGTKQPDWRVAAPKGTKFDAYKEELPTPPRAKWSPPPVEDDVPNHMKDSEIPF